MSQAETCKEFKDAIVKAILTLSLETTLEYVIDAGSLVLCPSATNLAFLVKAPSILMSNIMCVEQ